MIVQFGLRALEAARAPLVGAEIRPASPSAEAMTEAAQAWLVSPENARASHTARQESSHDSEGKSWQLDFPLDTGPNSQPMLWRVYRPIEYLPVNSPCAGEPNLRHV